MDLERFPTSPAAKRMLASVSEEFYAKSYVAKWLYQIMGLEWDAVWEIIDSLPEQAFVETATWGLMYHEIKWGLPVRENLDYATRRRLIYEKRDIRKPMNPWAMERMILDMTGRASRVTDSHDAPNIPTNTFVVEIESAETDLDIGAVLNKIRSVKQSHVSFTFLVCARVNVRISTPTYPYRFPYRMTGEHPDINVWGGMERDRVQMETDGRGHIFPYPVTGPHLAGTVPDTNTQGFIRNATAEFGASGSGAVFPYTPAGVGRAGTMPDTNTPAYIRDVGVETEVTGESLIFPYVQTGTKPDINTAGYIRRSAVRNEAEADGMVFPYPQSGTRPDVNVAGGLNASGIASEATGNGIVFPYNPAGESKAGTKPDVNIPGALRGLSLQSAASGSGAVFPYSGANEREAGTSPEENIPGSLGESGIAAQVSGEGTVFLYDSAGENPDVNTDALQRGVLLHNSASGCGSAFPYPFAGLETAGTIPDEQAGSGNGAELNGTATGSGTVIDYPLCGDDED